MFANFELYRDGWVAAAAPKPKHTRSCNGCLPCRKRKRKCDETRPVCGRCSKRNGRECHYPSSGKLPGCSRFSTSSESTDIVPSQKSVQGALSTALQSGRDMISETPYGILTRSLQFVPGLTEHVPSCSLADLFLIFHPATHALDLGPEHSIISLTIPMVAQSPAVFHAMVSCSSIFLSQEQPYWQSLAIRHHCKALHNLATEMTEWTLHDPAVAASAMVVVMMLHFFEIFDSSSRTPNCTHMAAAQEIFYRAFSIHPPDSTISTLLLEAFMFHIAINSTFHPELLKSFTHLEALVGLHIKSLALQHPRMDSFRLGLWLGLPSEMFDLVYKISFLQRMVPLVDNHWSEAVTIRRRLDTLHLPKPRDADPNVSKAQLELEAAMYYVRRLYIAAAELILFKIMHLNVKAVDGRIQRLLRSALDDMESFNSATPLLMYPVAVLGTAAIHDRDHQLLTSQLNRMRHLSGGRKVDSVLHFLQATWGKVSEVDGHHTARSDSIPPQLDVWLDDSRLSVVIV